MITLNAFLIFAPLPGFIRFSSEWTLFTSGLIKQAKKNPNINGIKIVRNFPITANTTPQLAIIKKIMAIIATKATIYHIFDTNVFRISRHLFFFSIYSSLSDVPYAEPFLLQNGIRALLTSFYYCLNSMPSCSRPFKIFFIAAVISASSSVLSFARKVRV